MQASDALKISDQTSCGMRTSASASDAVVMHGHYDVRCLDNTGQVLWEEGIDNLVVTVGINQILSSGVNGSTPAYMFLISSVGFSALAAADTMASHSGWNEVANTGTNTPPYGTTRPTVTYNTPSAGTITTSGTNSFVFTGSGTIEGAGIVCGSGASATVGNTSGVLMSEGTFATAQPVISGNTVISSYTLVA
jgi:hypothetical protein